ncbi:aquaporin AQPAn.G-like [Tripterygium wilfordii]|uniref:Aquaporin AQPAn.G-like n=1 Tax=Tripterygium wilfordii TaxID=458696 RepID=A0A7J7DXD6_TRIWF|nr:aquaporin-5-like [Tripterygium wilfordii]KAF5751050.1 aquaporin AQPAn.G-like [Tripterygium wilfordii]
MAANGVMMEDEESIIGGSKVQPFASTPKPHELRAERGRNKKENANTIAKIVRLEELFSLEVWRASVAELVGSAVLVFAIDTIVISSFETQTKTPNLIMSTLIAITLAILLIATIPVSGGNINPAVTLAAALTGLISLSRAFIYILAQCAGAILGALALKAVVDSKIEQTFSLGGCTLNIIAPGPNGPITVGLETGQALWLEIICTFVFLFAGIWVAFDKREAESMGRFIICSVVGLVVGLLVFISTTVTAQKGYAGVGMNPARCIGPAIVRGGHLWNGHWVFWAGPAIACVAYSLYTKAIPQRQRH